MTTRELLEAVKASAPIAASLSSEEKNRALLSMAEALIEATDEILAANEQDLSAVPDMSDVMKDRLRLTKERIMGMAKGIREVTTLPDPCREVLERTERGDGLLIEKVRVPIGVVAIIYESRPNVTSDAAALCLKSGNACVLRGGKEAFLSNTAITRALQAGLSACHLPTSLIGIVPDTDRKSARELMEAVGLVDLLIPRGGAGLIRACTEGAKVPCIETGTGICHLYIVKDADIEKALSIVENAKTSRPSVCNAAEVCLVHRDIAKLFLPKLRERLVTKRKEAGLIPVELRLDAEAFSLVEGKAATEEDFDTEFLDYILAVAVVGGADEAIAHILRHSTHHSEAIVTENAETAERFALAIDSAAVYINASTRFTDGGEFGLGCEIGISTQKLHARGPMGLCALTTYKYVIRGNGHIR